MKEGDGNSPEESAEAALQRDRCRTAVEQRRTPVSARQARYPLPVSNYLRQRCGQAPTPARCELHVAVEAGQDTRSGAITSRCTKRGDLPGIPAPDLTSAACGVELFSQPKRSHSTSPCAWLFER
jgi:hypothetical protein